MLNELYSLGQAMQDKGIEAAEWHREYKLLPKVTAKAPLIRIWLCEDGTVGNLESLDADLTQRLRKFGNNQGTFPAFNIAPLYRLTDAQQIARLEHMEEDHAKLDVAALRAWCTQGNWRKSLVCKIDNCLHGTARRLLESIGGQGAGEYGAVRELIWLADGFSEEPGKRFRDALEECAFRKLAAGEDVSAALGLLFYKGKARARDPEADCGTLSIILDISAWKRYGHPVASEYATAWINSRLLKGEQARSGQAPRGGDADAFGVPLAPLDEPMPSVKLKGFDVSLRTMFAGQPCQYRYRTVANDSYPIAKENRALVKKSLEWIAEPERENITWKKADQNELVFAYPSRLPKVPVKIASIFGMQARESAAQEDAKGAGLRFEEIAKELILTLKGMPPEEKPEFVQIFSIRKMDKARSKVLFTRCCTPERLIDVAEHWRVGCANVPVVPKVHRLTPYPLQIAYIFNNVWRQDGELANQGKTKVERLKYYQGLELLLDPAQKEGLRYYLNLLLVNSWGLFSYTGNTNHAQYGPAQGKENAADTGGGGAAGNRRPPDTRTRELGLLLSVYGLLLYKAGHLKEEYMEHTAYLVGQILNISDGLHELYCKVVRDGSIPPQLAGNGLLITASETPERALSQLNTRMAPYLGWARQYASKGLEAGKLAGWYLKLYRETMDKLLPQFEPGTRLDDFGKAQLFIGYLASLPGSKKAVLKEEDNDRSANETEEETNE